MMRGYKQNQQRRMTKYAERATTDRQDYQDLRTLPVETVERAMMAELLLVGIREAIQSGINYKPRSSNTQKSKKLKHKA